MMAKPANVPCIYCAVPTRVNVVALIAVTSQDRKGHPSLAQAVRVDHPTEGVCLQWACPECKVINRIRHTANPVHV